MDACDKEPRERKMGVDITAGTQPIATLLFCRRKILENETDLLRGGVHHVFRLREMQHSTGRRGKLCRSREIDGASSIAEPPQGQEVERIRACRDICHRDTFAAYTNFARDALAICKGQCGLAEPCCRRWSAVLKEDIGTRV